MLLQFLCLRRIRPAARRPVQPLTVGRISSLICDPLPVPWKGCAVPAVNDGA